MCDFVVVVVVVVVVVFVVVVVVVITQPHGVPHIVFGVNTDLHLWRVDVFISGT